MSSFPYSCTAAAALMVGHAVTGASLPLKALLALAPHLDLGQVQRCAARLLDLHASAFAASASLNPCMVPVREKYCSPDWSGDASAMAVQQCGEEAPRTGVAATYPPVPLQRVLELF